MKDLEKLIHIRKEMTTDERFRRRSRTDGQDVTSGR